MGYLLHISSIPPEIIWPADVDTVDMEVPDVFAGILVMQYRPLSPRVRSLCFALYPMKLVNDRPSLTSICEIY
jgi:hypothetical protein